MVVEIGHGDGSFIAALAAARPGGRYLGFDPNGAAIGDGAVELRAELFEPNRHLDELQPDLIISRHVMEHLANPLGFLQRLCFAVAHSGADCLLYLEVPCIDRVLETGRTVDLYYEHNSQFTTKSFSRMLTRCAAVVETIGHGYDGEVIFGLARLAAPADQIKIAEEAARYDAGTRIADQVIRSQLTALHSSGRTVAIWGGTGKSAAFMNRYRVDATRFPIIVDSDPAKVGTYVPGMGQEIRGRDFLKKYPGRRRHHPAAMARRRHHRRDGARGDRHRGGRHRAWRAPHRLFRRRPPLSPHEPPGGLAQPVSGRQISTLPLSLRPLPARGAAAPDASPHTKRRDPSWTIS